MLVWVLYGVGCLLTLYVNRFRFCLRLDRPETLLRKDAFRKIDIVRVIIAYGSIITVLWKYSTIPFVVAGIAYVIFTQATRKIFYHRYLNYLASEYKDIVLREAEEEGRKMNEEEAMSIAYKTAKEHIELNIKYKLF